MRERLRPMREGLSRPMRERLRFPEGEGEFISA